jgi:hypothetical protein
MKELTLRIIKHKSFSRQYTELFNLYKKLFNYENLSSSEIEKILSIVVLLANQKDDVLQRLAYRMALAYGNKTKDFYPLYDLAINKGLMPVVELISGTGVPGADRKDSFYAALIEGYTDNFRSGSLVMTEEQVLLNSFFKKEITGPVAVVAPTSYGKSELIVSAVASSIGKRICVIVPSKALLAQTKKRILDSGLDWVRRIISHPEMHRPEETQGVYVLTQERLTRVLNQDRGLSFDVVVVDEAHNLLDGDERSILLASVIRILEFRKPNTAFKFLTPFLKKSESLSIRSSGYKVKEFKVAEYVKSELVFLADFRMDGFSVELYDQFFNEFIDLNLGREEKFQYLLNRSACKNIIYLNRPKHIQEFALALARRLPEVKSRIIDEAIAEIGNSLDENYLLLKCIKHGVIYHHGSMSDPVRGYAEHLYRISQDIKYIVTSSTLLEGVNLPAEKMFLLSISKGRGNLRPAQFKNLIGRINRFSEVFAEKSKGNIAKLQPEVHIVATDDYIRTGANLRGFCEKVMRVTNREEDEVENVLLSDSEINEENRPEFDRAMARLENIESGINESGEYPIAKTAVGLLLLENNVSEIDVFSREEEISENLNNLKGLFFPISDSNSLMAVIGDAFARFIDTAGAGGRSSLLRMTSDRAQLFYAMFLDWRIKQLPMTLMIGSFIEYWGRLPLDTPVFVGGWGDISYGDDHREVFTYISKKSLSEKINLAIVRIKEEEDFLDYSIFKFIDILHDLEMLDEGFYQRAKYGTDDQRIISLIRYGFSRGVAELLLKRYWNYVRIENNGDVFIDPGVHAAVANDKIGFLQRQEIAFNVAG